MNNSAALSKLHHPDEVEKWEWRMLNHGTIAAVPTKDDKTEEVRDKFTLINRVRERVLSTPLFPATIISATILAVLGYHIDNSWLTSIAIVMILIFAVPAFVSDRFKAAAALHDDTHGDNAYALVDIPWGNSMYNSDKVALYNREAQRLTDVMNECKWMMTHGGSEAEREGSGKLYDEILGKMDQSPMAFDGGDGIYRGYLSKERTREAFGAILESRDKRLAMESERVRSAGEGITLNKTRPEDENASADGDESSMGSTQLPTEATTAIAFYESLAESNPQVVQLPIAAKRWSELSPMDRSNLTLLMEELSPGESTVRGVANVPGRERFLTRAREVLEENIAMAERVAQGINDSLDRAQLNSMEISGTFIRSAFSDSLTYSLEDEER